jgi:hypothetical protein
MNQINGSISLDVGRLINAVAERVLEELEPQLRQIRNTIGGTAVPADDVAVILNAHQPDYVTDYALSAFLAERLTRAGYGLIRHALTSAPDSTPATPEQSPAPRRSCDRVETWFDPARTD